MIARAAVLPLWLLSLAALLGCGSPIVGAECAPGLVLCDGRCMDSCDLEPRPDAGPPTGGRDADAGPADAGGMTIDSGRPPPTQGRGGVGNPFTPDGGFDFPDETVVDGCGIGETDCSGTCANLPSDHDHCGECGRACDSDQFCSSGECVDLCETPLRPCAGTCANFSTDERNCGGCGVVCLSGLCQSGSCADVVPGHLVVIGHDYIRLPNPTMQTLAGNALFLVKGAPVRTLVYRGAAAESSVFGVNDAINLVAASEGRQWSQQPVDPDQLGAQLVDADALLIHAQAGASDAELLELGQRWGLSMTQFLLRGGVIVLFDTQSTSNAGGFQLLGPAGLFEAESRAEVPPRQGLTVLTPGVGVAAYTIRSYQSQTTTVHFLNVGSAGTTVVEDQAGEAVVVHRVVVP